MSIVMANNILNPFILFDNEYTYEDNKYEFSQSNLYKHFKKVYIFCKLNNDINYEKLLWKDINIADFGELIKLFTLYETDSLNIIFNNILKKTLY